MSLCYNFQKWTIISLSSVVVSLIVGLVLMQYADGKIINGTSTMYRGSAYRESKVILRYCFEHADRPNPVQDLLDKAILTPGYFEEETCATVKKFHDTFPETEREYLRDWCPGNLKENLGHEPSELEIDNCVADLLEYEGVE
jgi:hypothetical protein